MTRDELIDEALAAQQRIARAVHATSDRVWLGLDLTMGQLKALFVVDDEPQTVGGLGDRLGIGKPAASILVERLVQLGLVSRTEDVNDRRRTLVMLSDEGRTLVEKLREGGQGRIKTWMSHLSDDDLASLLKGLQALASIASSSTTLAETE